MNNLIKQLFNELKDFICSFCSLIPSYALGVGSYWIVASFLNIFSIYFKDTYIDSPITWGITLFAWGILIGNQSILKLRIYLCIFLIAYYAHVNPSIQNALMISGFLLARLVLHLFPGIWNRYYKWIATQTFDQKTIFIFFCSVFVSSLIPRNFTSETSGQHSISIAKEAASMISASYSNLRTEKKTASNTTAEHLLQYMNFVAIDTQSKYTKNTDMVKEGWWPPLKHWVQQWNSPNIAIISTPLQPCSQQLQCLKLHNAAIVQFDTQQTFGGTANTNAIFFNLDPDGYGPEGRVSFYQYFNGRFTTGETKLPNTQTSATTLTSQDKDPKYAANW